MTAFLYDWNMLPIGQLLWEKELMSYKKFPPLQAPETYNLDGILKQVQAGQGHSERLAQCIRRPSERVRRIDRIADALRPVRKDRPHLPEHLEIQRGVV